MKLKMNWIVWLGFGISAIGAILIAYGQQIEGDKQNEALRTDLAQRTDQLVDLSKKLSDKSDELDEVIQGNNRFAEVSIFNVPNSGAIQLAARNTFSVFIEDVHVVMRDYNKIAHHMKMMNGKPTIAPDAFSDATMHFDEKSYTVAPGDYAIFKSILIDSNAIYTFVVGSHGKVVYEKMAFHKEGAQAFVGYFVTERDGKVIKEEFYGAPDNIKQILTTKLNSVYDNIQFSN